MKDFNLYAILLMLLFSCNNRSENKNITPQISQKHRLVDSINFYAFDSRFLPYMPDTSIDFKSLSEVSKYNFKTGERFQHFCQNLKMNYQNKDSFVLLLRPAQIQLGNLEELLFFRQIKASEKNISSMNLLSFFSPYSRSTSLKERIDLYNSFPENIKNSATGKKTWAIIGQYSFNRNIGKDLKQFSDVKMEDSSGNQLVFKNVLFDSHQYYILVFGASWCGPCRLEETQLKYWIPKIDTSQIKIIGLSIDKNLKEWKQYLREDKLPWKSYLLFGVMDNPVVKYFNFEGIPMNFLINKQGEVVMQNTDIRKILIHLVNTY